MANIGTESNPLRVAIIGSGPAGFYTVSNFFRQKELTVELDMYDRLPTPFGLVRAGVAPDHQKDKSVMRAYDKSAANPNFRFYGNVEYGSHLSLDDLKKRQVKAITDDQLAGLSQRQIKTADDFIEMLSNQQLQVLSIFPDL